MRPISKISASSMLSPRLPLKVPAALALGVSTCAGCPCRFSIDVPRSLSLHLSRQCRGGEAAIAICFSGPSSGWSSAGVVRRGLGLVPQSPPSNRLPHPPPPTPSPHLPPSPPH